VHFGQGEDFKQTMELSEKVQYSRTQAIKNSLNEAIILMSINEELKRTEFDRAFCKKFELLVDRFSSFFRLRQKIGRENDPSKENWGHRTSKIVKSRKSNSNGHLPYHLFILLLSARAYA